jgi:hypothetical protein
MIPAVLLQLAKAERPLARMARIYCVDVDRVDLYTRYFEVSIIPSTVFFFNAHHVKIDFGFVAADSVRMRSASNHRSP